MLRSSYESVPGQLRKCSGAVTKVLVPAVVRGHRPACSSPQFAIDQNHKSLDAHAPYPTMHHSGRNVHISVLNGALWGMGQVYYGIYEFGQLCMRTFNFDHVYSHQMLYVHSWTSSLLVFLRHDSDTFPLTLWGRMTHIYVIKLTTWSASSHYLNQCWNIVNSHGTKLQWNLNRNS